MSQDMGVAVPARAATPDGAEPVVSGKAGIANAHELYVFPSAGNRKPNQFTIETHHDRLENFERDYVCISGFFGQHRPAVFAAAPEMFAAMREFCERVEAGEIRSKRTYAKFRGILVKIGGEA